MLMVPKSAGSGPTGASIPPLGFGVVGLGGYGQHVLRCLKESAAGPDAPVRVLAVCDPALDRFEQQISELRGQGVQAYSRIEDLLSDRRVGAVWLPVPINLHCRFTCLALEAGKAVLCEKPAAGTVQEVDEMITARDTAGLVTAIGFQDIYDPLVQDAKRRILTGELGRISSASVWGVWPRDSSYYQRNSWAGAMRRDGAWVLDSPASNAMAHFVTLLLYLLGPTQETAATPVSIEAELYRANTIENYDTCGLRITLASGTSVLILLTHAGETECKPELILTGERGTLAFNGRESMAWHMAGNRQSKPQQRKEPFPDMIRSFTRRVTGGDSSAPIATLEIARQHVLVVNGASSASVVYDIPPEFIKTTSISAGITLRSIVGIESAMSRCAAAGQLPSESGFCLWAQPASALDLTDYHHFVGPRTR